jgi:multicomponent Na+:H+ antiporter subunit B
VIYAVPTSPLISTLLLDIGLLTLLVIVAIAIVRMRSLFAIVMLQGVYSLVAAAWFVTLDAVDVAFTEAAVGAGVSTVLMLAAMLLADRQSARIPMSRQWGPLAVVIIAGFALLYAVPDLPAYGDANSPANSYVGTDYLAKTATEVDVPNVVTAVLASYRGYDTFGEAVVIFAAGLGVLLLLGLNGNAGRFSAQVKGRRLSTATAPSGSLAHGGNGGVEPKTTEPATSAPATRLASNGPPSITQYERGTS